MKGFVIIHSFKDGKAMSDDRIEYANGDYVLLSDYDKVVDELISEKSYITQLKHDLEEMKRKHEDEIAKIKENMMSVIRDYIKHYRDQNDMKMRIAELESELESKGSEIERLKKRIGKLASIRVRCHESARDSFDLGNYGCLHIVTADELKTIKDENGRTVELPFDALETANMLINATYKSENCMTGTIYDKDIYDIDDLEQIAEHLLVYCKHNREEVK